VTLSTKSEATHISNQAGTQNGYRTPGRFKRPLSRRAGKIKKINGKGFQVLPFTNRHL
jgi:hypothetical protein